MLFSGEMVRAILDGRKTQTRRVVKRWTAYALESGIKVERAYYLSGDRLWVRETFRPWHDVDYDCGCGGDYCTCNHTPQTPVCYAADRDGRINADERAVGIKWTPSIHMPRKYSRILLEITDVRIERLQEISEADCRAEGIIDGGCLACGENEPYGCANPRPDARDAFVRLWNSLAKPGFRWADNPFVWRIEFKRVEAACRA